MMTSPFFSTISANKNLLALADRMKKIAEYFNMLHNNRSAYPGLKNEMNNATREDLTPCFNLNEMTRAVARGR